MSSDKVRVIRTRRKPKVSWGRFVLPGLVGTEVEAVRRRRWKAGSIFLHHLWLSSRMTEKVKACRVLIVPVAVQQCMAVVEASAKADCLILGSREKF
jgi:hypothetical protein